MRKFSLNLTLLLSCCLFSLAAAQDRAEQMKITDLPPATQKALRERSGGAKIEGVSKETVQGKTVYEVELLAGALAKSLVFDADGQVIAVEEQVAFDSLPPAVRAGIEKQAGDGKIVRVMSVKKGDEIAAYEARLKTKGKLTEIKVGADGKLIREDE
jgi:hypothetical protein